MQYHPFEYHSDPAVLISGNFTEKLMKESSTGSCRLQPGEAAAERAATNFLHNKLQDYSSKRNNPCLDGQSGLSPYLHFGQLSPQRLAWMVSQSELPPDITAPYLEELVVRRELSDNFCYYEPAYDRFAGFPEWARKTLDEHRHDPREYVYSLSELEAGNTHEECLSAGSRPQWKAPWLFENVLGEKNS